MEGFDLGIDDLTDLREIGSGGFATVYVAHDQGFNRRVAVKVLHSLDADGRRRFDRERAMMGQLSDHPNVITPYRFGTTPTGAVFLVMEFAEGGSLQDVVDANGPLAPAEAIDRLLPVVDALGHAHGHGILHRDIKPANILLTGRGVSKLTDFGIAAIRESTATQVAFTLAHAPPETFSDGYDRRDERSDLYSLASTLYALLAGFAPYDTSGPDSQPAYMRRIEVMPAPPLLRGEAVDAFFARTLAKDPAHRPPDAAAFTRELRALRDVVAGASAGAPGPPATRPGEGPTLAHGAGPGGVVPPIEPSVPGGVVPPIEPSVPGGVVPPIEPSVPVPGGVVPPAGPSVPGGVVPPIEPSVPGGVVPPIEPSVPGGSSGRSSGPAPAALAAGGVLAALVLVGLGWFFLLRDGGDDLTTADGAGDESIDASADGGDATDQTDQTDQTDSTDQTDPSEEGTGDTEDTGETPEPVDLEGRMVRIAGTVDQEPFQAALDRLSADTGLIVEYTVERDRAQLAAGDYDIVLQPYGSEIEAMRTAGEALALDPTSRSALEANWPAGWLGLVTVEGELHAVPVSIEPKSLLWYRRGLLQEIGLEVPTTAAGFRATVDQAALDGSVVPLCVGIESGVATGWVYTDWVEDLVLFAEGPDFYDDWVAHDVPFNHPAVVDAMGDVVELWKSPGAVFAAEGSIETTSFGDAGLPLLDGNCLFHRQGAFYLSFLQADPARFDRVEGDLDVVAFPANAESGSLVVSGVGAVARRDDPEVWAVMAHLATPDFADAWSAELQASGRAPVYTPVADYAGVDTLTGVEASILEVVRSATVIRTDASDQMPPEVGSSSFWVEGTEAVSGRITAQEAADVIEESWP